MVIRAAVGGAPLCDKNFSIQKEGKRGSRSKMQQRVIGGGRKGARGGMKLKNNWISRNMSVRTVGPPFSSGWTLKKHQASTKEGRGGGDCGRSLLDLTHGGV